MFVVAFAFALIYVIPGGPAVSGAPLQPAQPTTDWPKEASRERTLEQLQNMDAARLRISLQMELLTMATGDNLYRLDADDLVNRGHQLDASAALRMWWMLPLMKMMHPIISDSVGRTVDKVKATGGRVEHAMTYFFDDLEYRIREYSPVLYRVFERARNQTVGLSRRAQNATDEARAMKTLVANATNGVQMKKYFATLMFADKMAASDPAARNESDVRTAKAVAELAKDLSFDWMKLLQNIYDTALQGAAESVNVASSPEKEVELLYAIVFQKFMQNLEEGFEKNAEANVRMETLKGLGFFEARVP